jgi:uncharacterized protein (TIGR01244 family)
MWARAALLVLTLGVATGGNAQLMNRAEPLPGITTSGQPDEAALEELADAGFTTIIDLRAPAEDRGIDEPAVVEALGMSYVTLPVAGADDVTYENAAALEAVLHDAQGPVLVHCATGNRAGALLSLRQRLLGVDADEAFTTGVEAGMKSSALREAVETRLHDTPPH